MSNATTARPTVPTVATATATVPTVAPVKVRRPSAEWLADFHARNETIGASFLMAKAEGEEKLREAGKAYGSLYLFVAECHDNGIPVKALADAASERAADRRRSGNEHSKALNTVCLTSNSSLQGARRTGQIMMVPVKVPDATVRVVPGKPVVPMVDVLPQRIQSLVITVSKSLGMPFVDKLIRDNTPNGREGILSALIVEDDKIREAVKVKRAESAREEEEAEALIRKNDLTADVLIDEIGTLWAELVTLPSAWSVAEIDSAARLLARATSELAEIRKRATA